MTPPTYRRNRRSALDVTKSGIIRRDEVIAIRKPFEKRFKHSR